MLKIRLSRVGRKGQPHYRVVVAEHTAPIKGKCVEQLGTYDPKGKNLTIKNERVEYWISVGAKPTNTVARMLDKEGFKDMKKYFKMITFKEKEKEAEPEVAEAPAAEAEAPKTEEAAAPEEKAEEPKEEAKEEAPAEEEKKEE